MSESTKAGGFAYLFEKFPSFSQTFCFREVAEMRRQGIQCPVYSVREPAGEPPQDFPEGLKEAITYLPACFHEWTGSVRHRRKTLQYTVPKMVKRWGDEVEKRRIHEALWLAEDFQRRGIRHVHAHFAGLAARTAYWLHDLHGVSYSFTAHANDVFCDEPRHRLETMVEGARVIATETEYSRKFLQDLFPKHADKVYRTYNGIDIGRFTPGSEKADPPVVISVGRYIEKKGFSDLISACARLKDLSFVCQIVGRGPLEEELRNQAAAMGVADRVQITGPRSESEIIELLSRATLFVLPCVKSCDGGSDNLPTVIMEAMAMALPVISTPIAGVPEMVIDGQTGFLIPEHDPGALAHSMREILSTPSRAEQFGKAGRALAEDRFDIARTVQTLREVLERYDAFRPRSRSILSSLWS